MLHTGNRILVTQYAHCMFLYNNKEVKSLRMYTLTYHIYPHIIFNVGIRPVRT